MTSKGLLSFVVGIALASGCASVGVTKLGKGAKAKPEDCDLDVYASPAEVKRPYREVCLLDAQTSSSAFADKTVAGAVDKARPAACECGGDAILISDGDTEGSSMTGWGRGKAMLRAIVYTDQ